MSIEFLQTFLFGILDSQGTDPGDFITIRINGCAVLLYLLNGG